MTRNDNALRSAPDRGTKSTLLGIGVNLGLGLLFQVSAPRGSRKRSGYLMIFTSARIANLRTNCLRDRYNLAFVLRSSRCRLLDHPRESIVDGGENLNAKMSRRARKQRRLMVRIYLRSELIKTHERQLPGQAKNTWSACSMNTV